MSAAYRKSPPQPSYNARPTSSESHPMLAPSAPISTYAPYDDSLSYTLQREQTQSTQASPHGTHDQLHSQPHTSAMSEPTYQTQGYSEPVSATLPRIQGAGPAQGTQGEDFSVILTSATDLTADSRILYKIMFGSKRCPVTIHKQIDTQGYPQYALMTKVPPISSTGWYSNKVTVYLIMEDEQGQELSTEEVNQYTYTNVSPPQSYTTSPPLPLKKRKAVEDETRFDDREVKRQQPILQPDIKPKAEDYVAYSYPSVGVPSYPSSYAPSSGDDRQAPYYEQPTSVRQINLTYKQRVPSLPQTPFNLDVGSELPRYPQTTNVQPWTGGMYLNTPQPIHALPATSQPQSQPNRALTSLPSPLDTPNPPLVRTSTLQQSAYVNPATQPGGSFNPYAVYPHKAVLKLQGNLDGMAEQWNEEEWQNKRRLVQFWRQQKGSAIHTSFAPVGQSDRQSNSICISCIWWAEKNAAYVTSVDCIYLLESLIAVRFTVEEKNRIRRNLEGFHPLTVSKAKPDSENFFKLIMGFPNPKPRNIEKDVKVFPWKILSLALKKIIGKYSASYSSTASIMSNPSVEQGHDRPTSSHGPIGSPHSTTSSAPHPDVSGVNSPSLQSQAAFVHAQQRSPLARGTPPDMSVHVPAMQQTVSQASMWHHPPQSSQHQLPHLQHTQHLPAQGPRSGWDLPSRGSLDLSAYLDAAPTTGQGPQAMQYPRTTLSPSHNPHNGRGHLIPNIP